MAEEAGKTNRQHDIMEHRLSESTKELISTSESMKDVTEYGISRIYSNSSEAIKDLSKDIEQEHNELCFVGISLRALLSESSPLSLKQLIAKKAEIPGFVFRILLTHPAMAGFREQQEGRSPGTLVFEIIETLNAIREAGVPTSSVRLYAAPPTASAILTSKKMLFVPYSYSAAPANSISFIVENIRETDFYNQMRMNHFEHPWNSAIAISISDKEVPELMDTIEETITRYLKYIQQAKLKFSDNK